MPVSGMFAARRAISVTGRRPIEASHQPPAPASSNAIGITTYIASRTSCCSRAISFNGRAITSRSVVAPNDAGFDDTRHCPDRVLIVCVAGLVRTRNVPLEVV